MPFFFWVRCVHGFIFSKLRCHELHSYREAWYQSHSISNSRGLCSNNKQRAKSDIFGQSWFWQSWRSFYSWSNLCWLHTTYRPKEFYGRTARRPSWPTNHLHNRVTRSSFLNDQWVPTTFPAELSQSNVKSHLSDDEISSSESVCASWTNGFSSQRAMHLYVYTMEELTHLQPLPKIPMSLSIKCQL